MYEKYPRKPSRRHLEEISLLSEAQLVDTDVMMFAYTMFETVNAPVSSVRSQHTPGMLSSVAREGAKVWNFTIASCKNIIIQTITQFSSGINNIYSELVVLSFGIPTGMIHSKLGQKG